VREALQVTGDGGPDPDTAWYVATRSRSSPASSASGLSTGIAAIVVQFGFATMPLAASAIASGFTSDTTSGTSGSRRHAEELSMTTAPASANRGACSRDVPPPAEKMATSMSARSSVAVAATSSTTTSTPS
jgi:hypothetical protein